MSTRGLFGLFPLCCIFFLWSCASTSARQVSRQAVTFDETHQYVSKDWMKIQSLLLELGFDPGQADGVPGDDTYRALAAFEKNEGLSVTGRPVDATLQALVSRAEAAIDLNGRKIEKHLYTDIGGALNRNNLSGVWETANVPKPRQNSRIEWTFSKHGDIVIERIGLNEFDISSPDYEAVSFTFSEAKWRVKEHRFGVRRYLSIKQSGEGYRDRPHLNGQFEHLRSDNGVDILSGRGRMLVRFRHSPELDGTVLPSFRRFCGSRLEPLLMSISREVDAKKRNVQADPTGHGKLRHRQWASRLGLFDPIAMERAFGRAFTNFSESAQRTLIERLKTCALIYPDESVSSLLVSTLYTGVDHHDIWRDLGIDWIKSSQKSLSPSVRQLASLGVQYSVEIVRSQQRLAERNIQKKYVESLSEQELESLQDDIVSRSRRTKPSDLEPIFAMIRARFDQIQSQAALERERDLDVRGVRYKDSVLIENAISEFLPKDCTRSFLAVKALKQGVGLDSVLSASRIYPSGPWCVVEFVTHIFKFSLHSVSQVHCDKSSGIRCDIKVSWDCIFDLNPSFGFSNSTLNIDPVCPVVEGSYTEMQGVFNEVSARRWSVGRLTW